MQKTFVCQFVKQIFSTKNHFNFNLLLLQFMFNPGHSHFVYLDFVLTLVFHCKDIKD